MNKNIMPTKTHEKARFKPTFWMESFSWMDREYFNEGLIKTYNPEFCIGRIQSEFSRKFGISLINLTNDGNPSSNVNVISDKSYIFINYPDNELSDRYCDGIHSKLELGIYRIGVFIHDVCEDVETREAEFKDALELTCRFCGLFISKSEVRECQDGGNVFIFIVEPKFSDREFELNKCGIHHLYHITKQSRVGKILKMGLNPKSSNIRFHYPDRVYLGLNSDNLINELLPQTREDENEKYAVLKIDVDELPKGLKFNIDPNYPDGIFTSGNIPPSSITVLKKDI